MFRSNTEVSSLRQAQWEFCRTKVGQIRPPRSDCSFERNRTSGPADVDVKETHLFLHYKCYTVNSVSTFSRMFTLLAVMTRMLVSKPRDTRWLLYLQLAETTSQWMFTTWHCERCAWFASTLVLSFSIIRFFSHSARSSVCVLLLYDVSAT
jgi:hypothetical protein